MEANEIFKKVRRIEIKTRALSQQIFAGQYHSAFKGRGMAFSEVRQYNYGDDVRFIDWNVTARFNAPYVKIFEEEREMTVMLLIDVSGSNLFGTRKQFKSELITEIAAVLSFSAIYNNDKVGVIFFSGEVEKFIPPAKGKSHILRIIRELLTYQPSETQTDIAEALRFLTNVSKRKATVFLISDFVDRGYEQALKIAANRHDLVALNIMDTGEMTLPNIGIIEMADPETGRRIWVDSASKRVRDTYGQWWKELITNNLNTFRRSGIDTVQLYTDRDYVPALLELFRRRNG
ncbi:MAG: DUF58 domain-containing protein [Bacteroidales bacterium]|nr:DUF58 domain-containing protein [Bacteroidales bacterium]